MERFFEVWKKYVMFVYIQSALSFFQPNAKFSPAKHRRIFSKENINFSEDTGKFNIEFTKKTRRSISLMKFLCSFMLKNSNQKLIWLFGLTYFRGFAVVSQQSKVKSDFQPSDTTGSALKFEFFRKRQIKGKCLPQHKNTVNSLQNQCQTRQWQNWLESGKLLASCSWHIFTNSGFTNPRIFFTKNVSFSFKGAVKCLSFENNQF